MPKTEYTCIACPKGCTVEVEYEGDEIVDISGYACRRGKEYVRGEFKDPRRILTTTVKVSGGVLPRLPVRTEEGVPKGKLECCLAEINKVDREAPVEIGETLVKDVCGTGIDVVASRSLDAREKERV